MHISVHPGLLALALLCSFAIGTLFRLAQIRWFRKQILELEKEKMQDHAEILSLQKKLSHKQQKSTAPPATPVVPLKESGKHDEGKSIRATQ